jgi:tetratricopeptide (TPR) repeat protein
MRYFITVLLLSLSTTAFAQDLAKKVAIEICNCVDTVENMDSLEAKVNRCAQTGFEAVLEAASDEVQEIYSTEDAVNETISKAMESLITLCPKIRVYIIAERESQFYKKSDRADANQFYEQAEALFEKEKYKEALKLYLKSVKKDRTFIYAIDNTALTYRKLGDTKNAIKYYNMSLELYPEGVFALQNLAYLSDLMKDQDKALECYEKIAFFHPENPEGYFGIGRMFAKAGEYESALDYVFTAHKIYFTTKSEYLKDSEELISQIYNKLKEQNKLDLFNQKAKEYGININ